MEVYARLVVRTAPIFDGTTPETQTGYSGDARNALRIYKAGGAVGAFTTQDLGAPDKERSIVVWVRLVGVPEPGVSRVDLRSAFAGDAEDGYLPTSALLDSVPLATTWSRPLVVGPTDRVCPVHRIPGTLEVRSIDLTKVMQMGLTLPWGIAPPGNDCCISSAITVTADATLESWSGTRFVFVDSPTPVELQLPALNDVGLGRGLVVVPLDAGIVNVVPEVGEKVNGEINFGVVVSRRAAQLWRREGTWVSSLPIVSPGIGLTNIVAGAELSMSSLDGVVQTVILNYQAWGSVRLPSSSGVPAGTRVPFIRSGPESTGMVMVRPQAGDFLNGSPNRRAYIPEECVAELVKAESGWVLFVTQRNAVQEVPVGGVTVAPFAGTKTIRCTAVGAQAITLPAIIDCEPNALLIIEAVGGAKTATAVGLDVINGKGAPGATSIAAATGVNLYLRPSSANTWSAL